MSVDANGNEHHFEPTEFRDHVVLFDKTFHCHPLTREQMREHLESLNSVDGEYAQQYGISEMLLDFVMSLQKRALFGLRLALLIEETGEWCEAVLKDKPIEQQEDELADTEYVLHGAGDTMDYNMDAARGRVAIKNQKKITNAANMRIGEGGKVIKPEDQ